MTYRRSPDVLWRLGADRVLVRRLGRPGHDLTGTTALVWIGLETPRTPDELAQELGEVAGGSVAGEVRRALDLLERDGYVGAVE